MPTLTFSNCRAGRLLASALVLILAAATTACTTPGTADNNRQDSSTSPVRTSYVVVPVVEDSNSATSSRQLAARYQFPLGFEGPRPAVVIVHGSAGVDSRGSLHADSLNARGIATLELDLWAARGWTGSARNRPAGVPETLPDAFAALDLLAGMDDINSNAIGILGFSWGGVVTMLSATTPYIAAVSRQGRSFAAHLAFYPVCWVYNRVPGYAFNELSAAPLAIHTGELDDYDTPDSCRTLMDSVPSAAQGTERTVTLYPDAHHGFNATGEAFVVTDPFSHQGKGGTVQFAPNAAARAAAVAAVDAFFSRHLAGTAGAGCSVGGQDC